jgi:hypothetical protein
MITLHDRAGLLFTQDREMLTHFPVCFFSWFIS